MHGSEALPTVTNRTRSLHQVGHVQLLHKRLQLEKIQIQVENAHDTHSALPVTCRYGTHLAVTDEVLEELRNVVTGGELAYFHHRARQHVNLLEDRSQVFLHAVDAVVALLVEVGGEEHVGVVELFEEGVTLFLDGLDDGVLELGLRGDEFVLLLVERHAAAGLLVVVGSRGRELCCGVSMMGCEVSMMGWDVKGQLTTRYAAASQPLSRKRPSSGS